MRVRCRRRAGGAGFTLIELLVVIASVALLVGVLLPSLAASRAAGRRVACMVNMRSLEMAHWAYVTDHSGWMLGSGHGSSWMDVLRAYDEAMLLRSPVDTSVHFDGLGGVPIEGRYRRSSYAINFMVSPDNPDGVGRIDGVAVPSGTAHFVISAFEGPGAVSDHVHPHLWASPFRRRVPAKAAGEVQTDAHGGEPSSWTARSNYGFLDGHAETALVEQMYEDASRHRFEPRAVY